MNENIKDTLRLIEIQDTKKLKKEKTGKKTKLVSVEIRRVVIEDDDKTFKITLTQEKKYHPLKKLNISDLNTEVEADLHLYLGAVQTKIDKEFKGKAKDFLDKEGIEAEVK